MFFSVLIFFASKEGIIWRIFMMEDNVTRILHVLITNEVTENTNAITNSILI